MDASFVVVETAEGVATLTPNGPGRLNATTVPILLELRPAVDRVAADSAARCVVLTGAGRGFCAGHELTGRKPAPRNPPPTSPISWTATTTPLFGSSATRKSR